MKATKPATSLYRDRQSANTRPGRLIRTSWLFFVVFAASPCVADEALPEPADGATEATIEAVLDDPASPLDQVERQIEAEEYVPARLWLTDYIDGIEGTSHRFDQSLIRPLTLLGDSYAGEGDFEEALRHYQRALHLTRVNDGLIAPDQVQIVYREANALKAMGDFEQANDREEYAYHVLTRAHDPNDEAMLPGIFHLAEWYERTTNVYAARALYEHAVNIIDANGKLGTPAAIPALTGLASSYRMERFPPFYSMTDAERSQVSVAPTMQRPITINNFPAGEEALQTIVKIRQNQEPVDQVALAEAVLDLADWYTLFDKSQRADPLYAHAWELLAGVQNFDVTSYFADPALLYFPAPGSPTTPAAEMRGERTAGYVELALEVTDDGHVRDLDTVSSNPDGLMDFRVRKSARLARYRPMLVDGVPVTCNEHTLRHEFYYYPEREDTEPATASTGEHG